MNLSKILLIVCTLCLSNANNENESNEKSKNILNSDMASILVAITETSGLLEDDQPKHVEANVLLSLAEANSLCKNGTKDIYKDFNLGFSRFAKCLDIILALETSSKTETLSHLTKDNIRKLKGEMYATIAFRVETSYHKSKVIFNNKVLVDSKGILNYENIFDLYILSSKLGNSLGNFRTALFETGNIRANIQKLYFSSLDGNMLSQVALGYRHHAGLGVPKRCDASVAYYAEAALSSAKIIENRGGELVRDYERLSLGTVETNVGANDQDVIDYFSHSADKGDVTSMFRLGQYYLHGIRGADLNIKKAIEYFEQAAKNKDAMSYGMLGNIFLNNYQPDDMSNESRIAKAKEYFGLAIKAYQRSSTNSNLVGAGIGYNGLGYIKLYMPSPQLGIVNEVDDIRREALELFQKAVEHDSVDGLYNLGNLFLTGVGTKFVDHQKAIKFFTLASQRGHTLSQYRLGELYLHGIGVKKSCENALAHFKAVAEKSDTVVRLLSVSKSLNSIGRFEQTLQLLIITGELGSEMAQNNAAYLLDSGVKDVMALYMSGLTQKTVDTENSETKVTKPTETSFIIKVKNFALEMDSRIEYLLWSVLSPFEIESLFLSFTNTLNILYDIITLQYQKKKQVFGNTEALRFLALAAEQGNIAARVKIGDYFYYNVFENADSLLPDTIRNSLSSDLDTRYEIAAHHYKKAGESKNGQALFNLGYMHQTGIGLPQDFHLAKRYYDDAKTQDPDASFPVSIAIIGLYVHRSGYYILNGGSLSEIPTGLQPILVSIRKLYVLFGGSNSLVSPNQAAVDDITSASSTSSSISWNALDDDIIIIILLFGLLLVVNMLRQDRVNRRGNAPNGDE